MKVLVMVKASKDSEAGVMPTEQLLRDMGKFNEELVRAGILLSAEGLHPSSKGFRVRFSGQNRTVVEGPFAETNELVAGFWLWQVTSMEEAIEWVKRCPNPMLVDSEIEIRRVFAPEDFAPCDPSGELRAAEEKLRDEVEKLQQNAPRFEKLGEMLIAGLQDHFTQQTTTAIPALWERFVPSLGKLPGQLGNTVYGVCVQGGPDCSFDYLAGVEVANGSSLPEGFTSVRIPAARYAVFTHREHVSLIGETIRRIWGQWLPKSGYEAAPSVSFERYTEEFDPQTGRSGMEIWLPIKG